MRAGGQGSEKIECSEIARILFLRLVQVNEVGLRRKPRGHSEWTV
ncbi:MAG TPA: hypothetical protein VJV21_02915 [Pyrinomonadaceae bacterium]|nr:hypothetical protein [Pyrinomonadaceae bacterium]